MTPAILIDGNSIGFAAQMGGQRLTSGDLDTTGIFGFIRSLRLFREEFAGQIIILWDGRSWRYERFADYKGNREKVDPKMAVLRDAWKRGRPYVAFLVQTLGLPQLHAQNMEADDLAAQMRRRFTEQGRDCMLISSDHDWLQLLNEKTGLYDPRKGRRVYLDNFQEVIGLPTPKSLAEYKALRGDVSDNIPGVGGIGEKTAAKLLNEYGSVAGFMNVMSTDRSAYETADRRARTIADDEDKQAGFERNMELIWLDHPAVPAPRKPNMVPGKFNREAFLDKCAELGFASITRDVDGFLKPFAFGNK